MKKLLLALFWCTVGAANAQTQPVNLSNNLERPTRGFSLEDEDLPARNHGTGLRMGSAWTLARASVMNQQLPKSFELGFFHQHPLSRAISVQGEALYYRDATNTARNTGLRLPVLLVVNPFYNVSVHLGPQLQVRTGGSVTRSVPLSAETVAPTLSLPAWLTGGVVVGSEARVGFMRIGVRCALPLAKLTDLAAAGRQVGRAWQIGQVQAYLGVGF
ncbi:MAG: hypothetical protein H7330_16740 [Hymenobacteraceae bacterium]|nr:hypothetical protein [Hymenobacteraceae bacterium]